MAELDLTEAIEAAAKMLAYEAEEDSLDEALPWEAATEDYKTIFRLSAREVLTAAAPLIERAVREQVAKDIQASIVTAEARYGNCTCPSGKTCHPHACHEAMNRVTSRADEDTWPVHIAAGVWNELDPLIRRHAASIARGVGEADRG